MLKLLYKTNRRKLRKENGRKETKPGRIFNAWLSFNKLETRLKSHCLIMSQNHRWLQVLISNNKNDVEMIGYSEKELCTFSKE